MPLGFHSLSFDLFGFSRRDGETGAVISNEPAKPDLRSQSREEKEKQDREEYERAELSFWGIGYFPVL